MELNDFINCIMICCFIFTLIGLNYLTVNNENFKYFNETRRDGLMGIYYQNSYYCVWVKDIPEWRVANTEVHEQCHHMVYMEKEHFCD